MERGYKMRIYPNQEQKILINKTLGCVRSIYNRGLALREENYKKGLPANYKVTNQMLTDLKADETTAYFKEPDSIALQQSLRDLDTGYVNFFSGRSRRPVYKSKHNYNQSYRTINQKDNIRFDGNRIKLPKLGWVKVKNSFGKIGTIHSVTVRKTPSGKYYISILADFEPDALPSTVSKIGVDVGIKDFCVLSDGTVVPNPKFLKKKETKLRREQRKLSRKMKGSNNYNKQRIKVAKVHEQVTNQKKDFLQKLTTALVNENQVICVEHLNVKGMLKNHKLAKAISSVSWYEFFRILEYKCKWYARQLVKVSTYYPSSQTCHVCGYKNPEVKNLAVRKWVCPQCGAQHDRDENAAINILSNGLAMLT